MANETTFQSGNQSPFEKEDCRSRTIGREGARWRVFLAGVMQGSLVEKGLVSQDYRGELKRLLAEYLPEAEVYDPLADHKNSLDYDRRTGREVFFYHNEMCRSVDLLIAYLPQASMGTAIEMWEAYQHGGVVVSISPMRHNWVVKFLSHRIYPDLDAFRAALASGEIRRFLVEHRSRVPSNCGDLPA